MRPKQILDGHARILPYPGQYYGYTYESHILILEDTKEKELQIVTQ